MENHPIPNLYMVMAVGAESVLYRNHLFFFCFCCFFGLGFCVLRSLVEPLPGPSFLSSSTVSLFATSSHPNFSAALNPFFESLKNSSRQKEAYVSSLRPGTR
jgi:hypothetical protein